jgi:hypothetical protein
VANTLITMQQIAARALATLYNNTVFAGLVYRDYDDAFSGKQGDTVSIKRPATFQAQMFDGGSGIVIQDINERTVPAVLNKHADVSFGVSSADLTLKLDDFDTRVLKPAMEAIWQKIDGDLAAEALAMAVNGGDQMDITAATTDIISAVSGNHGLQDGDRVIFPTLAGGAGLTAGSTVYYVRDSTQATLKVSATLGGTAVDITTAYTSGKIALAPGGTVAQVSGQPSPNALIDARTALTANKIPTLDRATVLSPEQAGDLLKDPLFRDADKRGDTDGIKEASIGYKLGFNNTESQVYSGLAAGTAFHRQALALVTRPLELPMGASKDTAARASYKGLGLRVVKAYDINKKQDVVSVDVLYGTKRLRPSAAVKLDLSA